jgi:hypothetical protein
MDRTRLLYSSENGDRWLLVREFATDRVVVRHEANPASGGHVTDMDVDVFLSHDPLGPEHTALRRILGKPAGGR